MSPDLRDTEPDSDEHLPSPTKPRRKKGKARAGESSPQDSTKAPTRPNRFYGPPSTWLSWTRSERETVKALQQERAANLSAHLFIAHRIKKHARGVVGTQQSRGRRSTARSPGSAGGRGGESGRNEEKPFVPPKVWTAWPMPPDQVPRVFHSSGILDEDDPCTIRLPPDPRPSAELEECLIATTTRIARERWNAREFEDGDASDLPVSGRHTEESKLESSLRTSARPYFGAQRGPSSPPVPLFSSQPIDQYSPSLPLESHLPASNPALARSPQSSSRSRSGSPPQFLPPQASLTAVPIADDEQARTLLLPSARRTITKLDDLLLGLHRARQAYAGEAKRRGGGSETQTEDEASRGRSTGRNGKGKRKWKGGKTTVSRSRAVHEGGEEEEEFAAAEAQVEADLPSKPHEGETSSPAGPPSRKRSRISYSTTQEAKLNRLGLRDWSDVLGMAALTGWDSDVVARAGERCARLFGEEMGFRTFHPPGCFRGADTNGEGAMGMGKGKGRGGGKGWVEEWSVSGRGVVGYEEDDEDKDDDDDDDDDNNENDDNAEEKHDGQEGTDAGIDSNVMDTEEEEEEQGEEDQSIGPHRSSSPEEERDDEEEKEENS